VFENFDIAAFASVFRWSRGKGEPAFLGPLERASLSPYSGLWVFLTDMMDNVQNLSHSCDHVPSSGSFRQLNKINACCSFWD